MSYPAKREEAFAALCEKLLAGERPREKLIKAAPADLSKIVSPYRYYTDEDLAHRYLYGEFARVSV